MIARPRASAPSLNYFSSSQQLGPAAMRSSLHSPVPSSTLLRFLKSQSEGVCFFSQNARPSFIFDHAAPRSPTRARVGNVATTVPSRTLSTTYPKRATVEAGFGQLDFLLPRAAARRRPQSPRVTEAVRLGDAGQRNASSRTTWQEWRRRLWRSPANKGGRPLHKDDIPPLKDSEDSAFILGHRISAKAAAQPRLRCTELDENGNVVLASGEFKKSELIAKVGRHAHRTNS